MAIKIFKSSESKEVIVHSIISLFVRVLSVLSAFLMNLTVARVLGVEGAGYFLLALSIITFLSTVGRCGFDNLVLRFSGISSGQNTTLISSQILKNLVRLFCYFSGTSTNIGNFLKDYFGKLFFKARTGSHFVINFARISRCFTLYLVGNGSAGASKNNSFCIYS